MNLHKNVGQKPCYTATPKNKSGKVAHSTNFACDVKVLRHSPISLYNKFARFEYCSLMHFCSHMFIVLCMFILPREGDK